MIKDLISTLKKLNRPVAYMYHSEPQDLPYFVVLGDGQTHFDADNTYYDKTNFYSVEYYFVKKNEAFEEQIENTLLQDGFKYEKSEDVYIDSEDMTVIYYTVN